MGSRLLVVGGAVVALAVVAGGFAWWLAASVDRARAEAGEAVRLAGGLRSEMPAGWRRDPRLETDQVPLVAQGPTEADQLIVRAFPEPGGAEATAIWTATGLAAAGKPCSRPDGAQPVWNCSYDSVQGRILAYYQAVEWPERSVLVFLQGNGEDEAFHERLAAVVSATRSDAAGPADG